MTTEAPIAAASAAIIWVGLQWFRHYHLQKMILRYRGRAIARGFGDAFDHALAKHEARCAAQKKRVQCWEIPGIYAAAEAACGVRPVFSSESAVVTYMGNPAAYKESSQH